MLQLADALMMDGVLNKGRELGKSVALHSDAGCEMQDWHMDFNPLCKRVRGQERECIRDLKALEMPLGVFWAVEQGCKIMLVGPDGESVELRLELGDVLIFQGDLVHAGAAYLDGANMRVHTYLYASRVSKPVSDTYKLDDKVAFVPTRNCIVVRGRYGWRVIILI